jgi:prolyl-tRNA synthetase
VKLRKAAGAAALELAPGPVVEEVTGAPVGFAGPVRGPAIRTIFDVSVKSVVNAVTGANEKDRHYAGVVPGRDFTVTEEADISSARGGDGCPRCDGALAERRGIEVGHIFKLGYKYTRSMNLTVLDEHGKPVHPIMGCYGIGVNRTMAAIIEQHHDGKGIIWPITVAPFEAHLVGITKTADEERQVDEIYGELTRNGVDVLFDDRKASPGVKFADADLIGIPIRVTMGKNYWQKGQIEIKLRGGAEVIIAGRDGLLQAVKGLKEKEYDRLRG